MRSASGTAGLLQLPHLVVLLCTAAAVAAAAVPARIAPCETGSDAQRWELQRVPTAAADGEPSASVLRSVSGLCLDVGDAIHGNHILASPCNASEPHQSWRYMAADSTAPIGSRLLLKPDEPFLRPSHNGNRSCRSS
jgi:hypothetical protein